MRQNLPTKSPTKLQLIDFIKNAALEVPYIFELSDMTIADANKFIHRMRVELARMRNIVKQKNRVPRHFKMIVIDVVANTSNPRLIKVTLLRTTANANVDNAIDEVMDELAGGAVIEN